MPAHDVACLTVRVPTMADSAYEKVIDVTESEPERLFDTGSAVRAGVSITSLVPMWTKIGDYLTCSQSRLIIASFPVISIVMMIMFRSAPLGLTMSAANASVVAPVLGFMGWSGITLDPHVILITPALLLVLRRFGLLRAGAEKRAGGREQVPVGHAAGQAA
jgi:predicted RND superfamily exporter protein